MQTAANLSQACCDLPAEAFQLPLGCCSSSAQLGPIAALLWQRYAEGAITDQLNTAVCLQVQQTHVMIQGKSVFSCVRMDDFLVALSEKVSCAMWRCLRS